jgi:hypothetical protein
LISVSRPIGISAQASTSVSTVPLVSSPPFRKPPGPPSGSQTRSPVAVSWETEAMTVTVNVCVVSIGNCTSSASTVSAPRPVHEDGSTSGASVVALEVTTSTPAGYSSVSARS